MIINNKASIMYRGFVNNRMSIYLSLGQVFKPTKVYKGQKLIKLVKTNTPASASNTMPSVPEIIFIENKTAITKAIRILTILSMLPMFFFIYLFFNGF